MAEPRKTAGMLNFERQLDAAFPHRRKPDGWIADERHTGVSDHHPDDTPGSKAGWDGDADGIPEVRGCDVWKELGDGIGMQAVVDHLIALPHLSTVIRYLIFNGHIYHERNGFAPEAFDGDPHTDHLHVSFAWSQGADTNTDFDFRLEEITDMTPDELLGYDPGNDKGIPNPFSDAATNKTISPRTALYNSVLIPLRIQGQVSALTAQVTAIGKAVSAAVGQHVDVDEQAIVTGILAGLSPEAIAAAIPPEVAKQIVDELTARLQRGTEPAPAG